MVPLPHPDIITTRERIVEHARSARAKRWPATANPYHEGTDLHAVWRAAFDVDAEQAAGQLETA